MSWKRGTVKSYRRRIFLKWRNGFSIKMLSDNYKVTRLFVEECIRRHMNCIEPDRVDPKPKKARRK